MELKDLAHDEQLACLALVEYFVLADQAASTDERRQIDKLAAEFGNEAYRSLMNEADEKLAGEDDLKTFLGSISGQDARNLIYGTVMECAFADGLAPGESDMLSWLETNWNIEVKLQE